VPIPRQQETPRKVRAIYPRRAYGDADGIFDTGWLALRVINPGKDTGVVLNSHSSMGYCRPPQPRFGNIRFCLSPIHLTPR
jgi:hypothetical protein